MAFLPLRRDPTSALPSMMPHGVGRYRAHHDSPYAKTVAIPISGIETRQDAPPPLPPPRILPLGDALRRSEDAQRDLRQNDGRGPSSWTSGYGSILSPAVDDQPNLRPTETATYHNDEGYASYVPADRSRDSLPKEFVGLHHSKFNFQTPADLHTDSIKKKLDPIRNFDKSPPRPLLTSSVSGDLSRRHLDTRLPPALLVPTQVSPYLRPGLDSPSRMVDTPIVSAASSRRASFHLSPAAAEHRSPYDLTDSAWSRLRRRNNSDDATSTRGSHEAIGHDEMEVDESSSFRRLHIDESFTAAGQKRRAASPPSDLMPSQLSISGKSDVVRRRDTTSRGSPTPRLSTLTHASSMPPMVSTAVSRSGPYMPTSSTTPSSLAGMAPTNSFGRPSPGGASPGGVSPTSCNSSYSTPASQTHSSRAASISGRPTSHVRTTSGTSPRKLTDLQKPGNGRLQGFFMCECCPKKPKRFETAEELSAHEAEKQYECAFCGNRFKNKNEAERHQNSLHVRRHSWSCSALAGYDRAFHDSTNRPGEVDTCGYCGDEFPRSGRGASSGNGNGSAPRHATDLDWEERIRHLQDVHKFRECNSAKKFYRADHFRQHLKHSHAGTSGKWTNMLENACMVEEAPSPR